MYKDIKTVEQAFAAQKDKIDLSQLPDLSSLPAKFSRGMLALLKLQVITEAVNNDDPAVPDWEPDYNNDDQRKWFPWYQGGDKSGAGFRFYGSDYWWTNTNANGRAQLCSGDFYASHTLPTWQKMISKQRALVALLVRRRPFEQAKCNETIEQHILQNVPTGKSPGCRKYRCQGEEKAVRCQEVPKGSRASSYPGV